MDMLALPSSGGNGLTALARLDWSFGNVWMYVHGRPKGQLESN